ncbi:kelch-like protein 1 [Saccostrea echinata]|uniref:kelch-like protein 1 n=1 Tax=Saccostrea echinata TaxID=191078 RepID=UPI002A83B0FE|nr:kelch-like protein 1 [Saccostrea echinata]
MAKADVFQRGPLSFMCWEDCFPQEAWEKRRRMNLQKAESKPSMPPSEPVTTPSVTSKIRHVSNWVAQHSAQSSELQYEQGCSASKRYSPSLSSIQSESSGSTNSSGKEEYRHSKPSTPPSKPVTTPSVTSKIRHVSNLVAQHSAQSSELQQGQGCSAFKRYSPSLSSIQSESSGSTNGSGKEEYRRSKPSTPPSEPVTTPSVTSKIRQVSNWVAQHSAQSSGLQQGQGCSTSKRYSPSLSSIQSESSGSTNGSGKEEYRRSKPSTPPSEPVKRAPSETSKIRQVSNWVAQHSAQSSGLQQGQGCSNKDRNENTKREISDPDLEPSENEAVSHYSHLGDYITKKYEKKQICDICFKINNTCFPAHRIVLASQSQLFQDIFERDAFSTEPVAPKVIRVRGVSEEALKSFLDYLYTGRLNITSSCISDIIKLAHVFEVQDVRKMCLRKLEKLSYEALLHLLPTMTKLEEWEICNFIVTKITKNFMEAKECTAFFHLDPDTLCMILSSDTIMVPTEFDVFSAAVSWIQHHDFEKRALHLEKVMSCIRFSLMSRKELFLCFKKFPPLRNNLNCVNMITLANWAQTSFELEEEDPLNVCVNKRDMNSPQSISNYLKANSSADFENEAVEVEVTNMSEEMAQDFNCHAYMPIVSSSSLLCEQHPKVQQYSTSKCGTTEQKKASRNGHIRSPKRKGRKNPENSPIWQLHSMRF